MKWSCLHTHTNFCDGKADIETMCETAYAKGFESIGFSSHAPILKKTGIRTKSSIKEKRLDEYIDRVLKARKYWNGKLSVYLGLEVDYVHGLCGPADADIQALPLDYIIGAVHFCSLPKKNEFFSVDESPENFRLGLEQFDNDGYAFCEAYYNIYNNMINAGAYDILAHLDLIKKNNDLFRFFTPGDSRYTGLLKKTVNLIAAARTDAEKNGVSVPVVEVNTGGMNRGYSSEPYPSRDTLKLLAEQNVPLVLSADAHTPDQLGKNYEAAMKEMKEAGYTGMAFFAGRREGKAVWQEEALAI
ncbi:MAG: histidinol-phosphatase [Treponema sp.]|jgi:histidinol-phosphatase (PHP family)|nr:histidinol-phosphatase [Treponema sp.]